MIKTLRIGNYDAVFSGRIGEKCNTYDIVNIVRYDKKGGKNNDQFAAGSKAAVYFRKDII